MKRVLRVRPDILCDLHGALNGASLTWVYSQASNAGAGSSWTYKQGTFLAQNPPGSSTTGSYFGVDADENPLFIWSGIPQSDSDPDPTRALHVGNAYGIDLHL